MRVTAVYLIPLLLMSASILATCAPTPTPLPVSASPTSTPVPQPPPVSSIPRSSEPVSLPTAAETRPSAAPVGARSDASITDPFDTWVRPADGMVMVYVPGGSSPMGSAEEDPDALPDEFPQHTVTLDSFWIDQTEVTNAQFVQFLNEHGNSGGQDIRMIVFDQGYTQISQEDERFVTNQAALDRPVLMVTWHGAAAYCEWAGARLPTEAEWEYAARGPEGNLYPWGDAPPTCELANYGDCNRAAARVGSRPAGASWCGALDMAGNVWEWVSDWFGPYTPRPQENPTGPVRGDVPVVRGGGWHSPRWDLRAAYRQHEVARAGYNG